MVFYIIFWILEPVTTDASLCLYTQVFDENREGMVKLEPPSSSRVGDFTHLLSLIPSTSQSSVLSETLPGVEHDSLLMAAQHIRTEEVIQRFLTGEMYGSGINCMKLFQLLTVLIFSRKVRIERRKEGLMLYISCAVINIKQVYNQQVAHIKDRSSSNMFCLFS